MKRKRTPWFPASITPVRVGEYETKVCQLEAPMRRLFDGLFWRYTDGSPSMFSFYKASQWRGLTEPQEGTR